MQFKLITADNPFWDGSDGSLVLLSSLLQDEILANSYRTFGNNNPSFHLEYGNFLWLFCGFIGVGRAALGNLGIFDLSYQCSMNNLEMLRIRRASVGDIYYKKRYCHLKYYSFKFVKINSTETVAINYLDISGLFRNSISSFFTISLKIFYCRNLRCQDQGISLFEPIKKNTV